MNRPPLFSGNAARWTILFLVCGMMSVSFSGDSLWIDEITTALLARAPTWSAFIDFLQRTGSEMQMPLFSVYAWGWGRGFGTSEIALRLMNGPWMLIAVLSFEALLRRQGLSRSALFLLLLPFIGFSINEARPYLMTLAGSFLLLEGWTAGLDETRAWSLGIRLRILTGLIVTLGASLLNVFILPALLALTAVWKSVPWKVRLAQLRREGAGLAVLGLLIGVFGVYYGGTLLLGYGGQKQNLTVVNLGFALYEVLGFGGWGPPRYLLREGAAQLNLWKPFWPGVLLGAAVWVCIGLRGLWADRALLKRVGVWWGSAGLGALGLIGVAVLAPASLWGRHFMVFYPALLMGLAVLLSPPPGAWRAGWLLFLVAGLGWWGSLRLRLVPAYGKDPYRAVREAVNAQPPEIPIYWVAAPWAPEYYSIRSPRDVVIGAGWSEAQVHRRLNHQPEALVVLHRPDKFDPTGAWSDVVSTGAVLWEQRGLKLVRIRAKPNP